MEMRHSHCQHSIREPAGVRGWTRLEKRACTRPARLILEQPIPCRPAPWWCCWNVAATAVEMAKRKTRMKRRHNMPFGAERRDDGSVRFRLWAPASHRVELCL